MIVAQDRFESAGRKLERTAQDQGFRFSEIRASAIIVEPAFVLRVIGRDLAAQKPVDQGPGNHAVNGVAGSGFNTRVQVHGECVRGLGRTQQDGAARHVAAEQHPLWSTQHLKPRNIEIIENDTGRDAEVHAVYKDAHGRVDRRDRAVDA
jgi:hypothetical protein